MKREARQLQEVAEAAQLAVCQSEFLGEDPSDEKRFMNGCSFGAARGNIDISWF